MFASPRTIAILVTCATACTSQLNDRRSNHGQPDASTASPDGDRGTPSDGSTTTPDAPPGMVTVTLSQTTNGTPAAQNGVSCGDCNNNTNPCNNWYTAETAIYRVFDLAQHGITKPFHVSQVTFAVEEAAGTQSVQVKLGTYNGTPGTTLDTGSGDFAGGLVTQLATTSVNIPQVSINAPVSIPAPVSTIVPAGSKLIVSVYSPNHQGQTNTYFYLGATTAGETKPGYIRSPACGDTVATTMASIGYPQSAPIITVTGSH